MERDGCGLGHTAMEREYRCWLGHAARDGTRRVLVEGTPLAMERDGCGLGHTAMEREYRCWLGHTARGGTRRVRVRAHRCRCCRKAGGRLNPEKGEAVCIASLNGI
jgi:hypothetical protein